DLVQVHPGDVRSVLGAEAGEPDLRAPGHRVRPRGRLPGRVVDVVVDDGADQPAGRGQQLAGTVVMKGDLEVRERLVADGDGHRRRERRPGQQLGDLRGAALDGGAGAVPQPDRVRPRVRRRDDGGRDAGGAGGGGRPRGERPRLEAVVGDQVRG